MGDDDESTSGWVGWSSDRSPDTIAARRHPEKTQPFEALGLAEEYARIREILGRRPERRLAICSVVWASTAPTVVEITCAFGRRLPRRCARASWSG